MVIVPTQNINEVKFEDIECGGVFKAANTYYMKIEIPKNLNNAVNLSDGEVVHFNDSAWVIDVEHELVVNH